MQKHGIIFDCDGTLVDSLGRAMESFLFALKKIDEKPHSSADVKKYFGTSADKIFFSLLKNEAKANAAFECYLEHQLILAKETELHEGIPELLTIIEKNKIPIAIVTGRHKRDLEIVIERHNLAPRFVTLIADSELTQSKPAPEGILLAAERMGVNPTNTFYVGDSAMDMHAANSAGSHPIAALWDKLVHREEMQKASPKYMAQTPIEVWTHFLTHTKLF